MREEAGMLGPLSKSNYFKQMQGARGLVTPSFLNVSVFFSAAVALDGHFAGILSSGPQFSPFSVACLHGQ